jgi:hypothetical protein
MVRAGRRQPMVEAGTLAAGASIQEIRAERTFTYRPLCDTRPAPSIELFLTQGHNLIVPLFRTLILVSLNKLEAARRQLETAVKLYFAYDDEVSILTLAAAAYSLIRDLNEHRGGEPMLKDLHRILPEDLAREFKTYINRPENFLKHADKDPEAMLDLEPRWTEVLLWEASRKYCEMTGEQSKVLITFVLWFVARQPELR